MGYRRSKEPRFINVKYDSTCAETGKLIKQGEQAVYYPNDRKVYHEDSKTAYDFRMMKADEQMGYSY